MAEKGMGHKLKVARHKLLGLVKKDETIVDEDYDRAEAKFNIHVTQAQSVDDEIRVYIETFRKLASSSEMLGDVVSMYYRVPDKTYRAGEVFQNAQAQISKSTQQTVEKLLVDQVQTEWSEYIGFLKAVKGKIAERKKCFEEYDYYYKKLQQMKLKPDKNMEKLPQNEDKLRQAEQAFNQLNSELIEVFNILCDDATIAFNQHLQTLVQAIGELYRNSASASAQLRVLIDNSGEYGCTAGSPKYKSLLKTYGVVPPTPAKSTSSLLPSFRMGKKGQQVSDDEDDTAAPSSQDNSLNGPPPQPLNATAGVKLGVQPESTTVTKKLSNKGFAQLGFDEDDDEHNNDNNKYPPQPVLTGGKRVRALYEFESTNEDELSFREGDVMVVLEECEEGWWRASLNGKEGMIPFNYVEVI
eukprot:c2582_g1_i1.p1 GENE.c2582_g1_i1~~c2582_g1_i1.p1  ORF type:complete len:421 (+),score=129.33 c2582_g1_i1:30-1265(+)